MPIHTALTYLTRLAAVTALLGGSMAHADDYSDVMQLLRIQKTADAITRADKYLATAPRDPQMRFLKAVALSESGKPAEAIALFTQLTQEYPELPEPYNNLAVLYASQNQLDKARIALEMAVRNNPSYATAHENLGDIYVRLANQAYTKALQLDPNGATAKPKLALLRELTQPTPVAGAPKDAKAAVRK